MKAFANVSPNSLQDAQRALRDARQQGKRASVAGGGSDLLGLVKERLETPDVLVHLRSIQGMDQVTEQGGEVRIGGLITLDALSQHPLIGSRYKVLADAAGSVGTPQIRNAGTLAGNVCQRPWCWYYRNGFPCFKNGGDRCFSVVGENELHAIFGGGPSFIVHPSDTAPALVALSATFRIVGPNGERLVPAADFFTGPMVNAARENVLTDDELLVEIRLPAASNGLRSEYHKVLDREAWTHAVVSAAVVMEMDGGVCRSARIVLGGVAPIPWRVPNAEAVLNGQRVTEELAARAAETALERAQPLAQNRYKIPLTTAIVRRTLLSVANG
jgi:xanthine dehydrogenase YagS FAD-binding subunit